MLCIETVNAFPTNSEICLARKEGEVSCALVCLMACQPQEHDTEDKGYSRLSLGSRETKGTCQYSGQNPRQGRAHRGQLGPTRLEQRSPWQSVRRGLVWAHHNVNCLWVQAWRESPLSFLFNTVTSSLEDVSGADSGQEILCLQNKVTDLDLGSDQHAVEWK